MKMHAGKIVFKVSYTTETVVCISGIWLLVGLVMTLKSSNKRVFLSVSLCENFSDLTIPTSNHKHLVFKYFLFRDSYLSF